MDHLTDVTVADLQQALESTAGSTPTQRLVAAIAYKNGITQTELAEWFAVERKTIYNWLTRLEARDLESAIRDDQRPGRPRKLSATQRAELNELLHEPPTEVGYDAPAWTTDLVRQFIQDRFEIEYSRPSCRRLMHEAGLQYQTPRNAAEAEPEAREAFAEDLHQLGHVWLPP